MLIPHEQPLMEGRLLARFDRFIAEVELEGGRTVDAHCVNPGRMEGLVRRGARAWVSGVAPESRRKLRYTLEVLEVDGTYVGANTVVPNRLAEALIRAGKIPGLKRFKALRREVRYGERSRIDLLLTSGATEHLVEVKNCHLVYPDGCAYFPDSVSERAAGHLRELAREVKAGRKATVLFVLQHPGAARLRPSALHDPAFADAAREAAAAGVRFRAAQVHTQPQGFEFMGMIPVDLKGYRTDRLANFRAALDPFSGWQRRKRAEQC